MIDNFSLFVSHGLMLLAAWRLLHRPDLDSDHGERTGWFRRKGGDRGEPGDA
ncbi:MAG: hypothetical protein V4659_02810 [Pseudomonadota bacterium]